jgi:hypothetical protein
LAIRIASCGVDCATHRPSEDDLRLRNLVDLRLPGVTSIRLTDMVHIRDDDAFGVFGPTCRLR